MLLAAAEFVSTFQKRQGMYVSCIEEIAYKRGFIDKTGKVVIPCQWKNVGFFSEGMAVVVDANDMYGFIDKTGKASH